MADSVKVLVEAILKDDQFKKGVAGIKGKSKEVGKVMGFLKGQIAAVGSALATTFGALAVINGIKKLITISKEFEQSIANVAAVSGDAKDELAKLAREAGQTTVFSARQAADAMYFLASAGLDVKDMAEVLACWLTAVEFSERPIKPAAPVAAPLVVSILLWRPGGIDHEDIFILPHGDAADVVSAAGVPGALPIVETVFVTAAPRNLDEFVTMVTLQLDCGT